MDMKTRANNEIVISIRELLSKLLEDQSIAIRLITNQELVGFVHIEQLGGLDPNYPNQQRELIGLLGDKVKITWDSIHETEPEGGD